LRTYKGNIFKIACEAACEPPLNSSFLSSTAIFAECGIRIQTACNFRYKTEVQESWQMYHNVAKIDSSSTDLRIVGIWRKAKFNAVQYFIA
jgi:hypothetical protein